MLIDDMRDRRILVVGDVMLDHFIAGAVDRVSPEAPALVLRIDDERSMLGGAGNVASNIASLGGIATLVGVVGEDPAAAHVAALVEQSAGRVVDALIRSDKVTTTSKTRFIAGDRHLLRADRETVGLESSVQGAIASAIETHAPDCSAIVISDYAKGVVCPTVMDAAIRAAHAHEVPLIVDPKRRDFDLYRGADLLTPNRKELEFATGEPCDALESCDRAAREVMERTGAAILLTRSEDGVALFRQDEAPWSEPARARLVRDVSGAGDTVLAVCAVALAAGADLAEAAHVANVGASLAVGKSGTSSISPDELNFALLHAPDADALEGKLVSLTSAVATRKAWTSQDLKVGFTNGCFDLLHPGHIRLLAEARATCDRLIVGLNTDASVKRLKGEERPIQTEVARAEVIGALRSVDLVVLFDGDTPMELIEQLRPDVLVKGADYTIETVVGADLVQSWGGEIALIDLVPGQSSTSLIAASRRSS
ncbi:MAG: D-glycero-beta-D-manno-heptose 1-phosphate adenylyltransferase [Solirubrobacteraceae bacterium]|nr:D-glycero-beta-D-manno-heptose 1-phosphate adenylyltransferase [Solirubrobacteraceae bacterium]